MFYFIGLFYFIEKHSLPLFLSFSFPKVSQPVFVISSTLHCWSHCHLKRQKNNIVKCSPAFQRILQHTCSNHQLSVLNSDAEEPTFNWNIPDPKHWNLNYWQADLLLYSILLALGQYESIFPLQRGLALSCWLMICQYVIPIGYFSLILEIIYSMIIFQVSYLPLDSVFFITNVPFGWFLLF